MADEDQQGAMSRRLADWLGAIIGAVILAVFVPTLLDLKDAVTELRVTVAQIGTQLEAQGTEVDGLTDAMVLLREALLREGVSLPGRSKK